MANVYKGLCRINPHHR